LFGVKVDLGTFVDIHDGTFSSFVAISWHEKMDLVLRVVPCYGEDQVALTVLVMGCFILLIECLEQVIGTAGDWYGQC